MVELLRLGTSPEGPQSHYAATQFLGPRGDLLPPDGIRLSPVLDLLGVRYVIFRGTPPPSLAPAFRGADYWAMINRNALPRIFVPRQWKKESDPVERLARLGAADFDPRKTAIVETTLPLPEFMTGTASIISETPTRITAAVELKTPGLVVLADHFDAGWQAYFDGRPTTPIRVDHALRGAVVPAGKWTLEFRYEPASVAMSFALAGVAAFILLGWVVANRVARRATAG
jgi:hypothetical protein